MSADTDLEAHGGLYTLHSHLNHCCAPNVSVRHLDRKTYLSRITVIAKADIEVGQELLVTYVNPQQSLAARRRELSSWAFGICRCSRCIKEEKEEKENPKESADNNQFPDLADELRDGLGVF